MLPNHPLSHRRHFPYGLGIILLATVSLSIWLFAALPLNFSRAPIANFTSSEVEVDGPAVVVSAVAAREVSAERWQAMSKAYGQLAAAQTQALNRTAHVSVQRWEAMGRFYAPLTARQARAAEASLNRWQAMGRYYTSMATALAAKAAVIRDIDASRWEALGAVYSTMDLMSE